MKRQSTFVFHHASHPWSKSKILIWMVMFHASHFVLKTIIVDVTRFSWFRIVG